MPEKRTLRVELYKKLLSYTCAHPECNSGLDIEAHHIRPLHKGGFDKFWNIISLCFRCHHKRKLHSRSEEVITELYVYKSMHELDKCGFIFDENEEGFTQRLRQYHREYNLLNAEEELLLENIDTISKDKKHLIERKTIL